MMERREKVERIEHEEQIEQRFLWKKKKRRQENWENLNKMFEKKEREVSDKEREREREVSDKKRKREGGRKRRNSRIFHLPKK